MACTIRFLLQEKKAQIYRTLLLNTHFYSTGFFLQVWNKNCNLCAEEAKTGETDPRIRPLLSRFIACNRSKKCPWKRRKKTRARRKLDMKKMPLVPHTVRLLKRASGNDSPIVTLRKEDRGGKGTSADCIWRLRRRRRGKLHENKNSRAKKCTESFAQSHLKQQISRAESRGFKSKNNFKENENDSKLSKTCDRESERKRRQIYFFFWSPQGFFSSRRRKKL